jgi:NADPH2:quinone reductase
MPTPTPPPPLNTSPTPSHSGRWTVTAFGTPSVLKWQSYNPELDLSASTNVLIRIIVAGIAGVDNIQRVGGYPDPRNASPGFTTGYDIVGEVLALDSSVPHSALKVGDRVASLCRYGGHATHIVLPYQDVIRIEHTDDPVKVCALPLNYMTAWGMLKHSGVALPPGSSILLGSASGGLGTAVAQLVAAFDMGVKIIGTCSPAKFEYVKSLGVQPIDRNAKDLVEQVRKLTNEEGVDVAFDGVCSEESVRNFRDATKDDGGRVVVFGVSRTILIPFVRRDTNANFTPARVSDHGRDCGRWK